jgi:ribonucleoside-diphosphate reductase alpha chain
VLHDALALAEDVMKHIDDESKDASRSLAKERGPFPNFKESAYNDNGEPYIRNATTTTIAPTGTISIIAGTSSGIEPVFALCYTRNVLDNEKLFEAHPTFESVARREGFFSEELMKEVAQKGRVRGVESVPEQWQRVFVTAHEVSPEWHVKMQASFQKHTDNAVSKTVNFCNTASPEDVSKVFFMAYRTGCKGITVFRDGCREKQVLETGDHKKDQKKQHGALQDGETPFTPVPRSRPDVVTGTTRKLRTGCGNLYVTINCDDEGMPFELFCSMGKAGGCAASQSESIARLISFAFRSGANINEITKHLKGISCHRVGWEKTGKILSCADGVAKALELFVQEGGRRPSTMAFSTGATHQAGSDEEGASGNDDSHEKSADGSSTWVTDISALARGACPECGGIIEHESGCVVCKACGFSECQ